MQGGFGWQDYCVTDGKGPLGAIKLPPGVPLETALSLFGITGLTAYFGMVDVAAVKAGDTVVVSGAAGSTGSLAAQIAKNLGANVIGIAGGAKKKAWLTNELKLDAGIDYILPEAIGRRKTPIIRRAMATRRSRRTPACSASAGLLRSARNDRIRLTSGSAPRPR